MGHASDIKRRTGNDVIAKQTDEWRAMAERLLEEAGRLALRHFRQPLAVEDKGDGGFDPVTVADRAVEAHLRAALAQHCPEHGITGEEQADRAGSGEHVWVIDPIDGTRSFITGMPLWGILLGLLHGGTPVLGFMHQPCLGETFGGDGRSAWLVDRHGRRALATAATDALAGASVYTTHPEHFASASDEAAHRRLAALCRLARYGGDCYSYCMLAAGHVDLVVESGLAAYDILPLVPIIEGAGGTVTDWEGRPLRDGGRVLAAANAGLHRAALEVLNAG